MCSSEKICLWVLAANVFFLWFFLADGVKERSQEIADKMKLREVGYNECVKAFKDESQCFNVYFSDFRG